MDEQLTEEIIISIFSYLNDKELCLIAQVNKRFRRVSEDNEIWKTRWEQYKDCWGTLADQGKSKLLFMRISTNIQIRKEKHFFFVAKRKKSVQTILCVNV